MRTVYMNMTWTLKVPDDASMKETDKMVQKFIAENMLQAPDEVCWESVKED